MQILTPFLTLSLLHTTALTSPTPAPADLNMDIIAIEDGTATTCRCVRSCYFNMQAYCDSCPSITDPFQQFQCVTNPCCECVACP